MLQCSTPLPRYAVTPIPFTSVTLWLTQGLEFLRVLRASVVKTQKSFSVSSVTSVVQSNFQFIEISCITQNFQCMIRRQSFHISQYLAKGGGLCLGTISPRMKKATKYSRSTQTVSNSSTIPSSIRDRLSPMMRGGSSGSRACCRLSVRPAGCGTVENLFFGEARSAVHGKDVLDGCLGRNRMRSCQDIPASI